METIYVYADFDFLDNIEEIGTLRYEKVRGNDHFTFEFSKKWLDRHGGILLSGDIMNSRGLQHPRGNSVFGFVSDSFPDRWGRTLLDRRERIEARNEGRTARTLNNFDYLTGIEDLTRMGGIRYKTKRDADFICTGSKYSVPPIENLRVLCDACQAIEKAEEHSELPEQKWLDQLVNPGSSLGGARPKANVADNDGTLFVAKFPSKKDLEDTELLEHFAHKLAQKAGINAAETSVVKISNNSHLMLSKRFDRTGEGKRIHFASAMALLALADGSGANTGNGYLDIVDFIVKNCADTQKNLEELYRRVAFNILFGNTDDHFRNHGFLLTPKGWTLAPAYDITPSTSLNQCLLINDNTEQSDISILRQSCESYMLDSDEADEIIAQVTAAIADWQGIATSLHIPLRVLEKYSGRWNAVTEK